MDSVFSFVVGLLTAAMSLLGFVQQHPELPQASRDQAQQVAQQAITQATNALSNQNTSAQTNTSAKFTATPISGTAPLTVKFAQSATDNWRAAIEYGDGTTCAVDGTGEAANCQNKFVHTYTAPGTYTVKLWSSTGTDGASRPPLGTLTITVSAQQSSGTQASFATINKTSLSTNSKTAKITGTCGNVVGTVAVYVVRGNVSLPAASLPSGDIAWSDSTTPGQTLDAQCSSSNGTFSTKEIPTIQGAYTVGVYNVYKFATANTGAGIQLLASGTLNSSYQTADVMPTTVGQCVVTTVKQIDSNVSAGTTGEAGGVVAGRSALQYTAVGSDGYSGRQTSDTYISGIDNSRAGDSVKLCLKSYPQGCPSVYGEGMLFTATNLRTNQSWDAYNSRHLPQCASGM